MEELNSNTPYSPVQQPNDLLVWSILSTVFCCIATGIVAIVYSSRVSVLWEAGRQNEAFEAARKAKTWNIAGLIIGIVFISLYFVFTLLGITAIDQAGGLESFAELMNQFD